MTNNDYSGTVSVEGMLDFLGTLDEEIEVSTSGDGLLMEDLNSDMAIKYLEGIVGGEANGKAEPWDDYDGNGLMDPESLEPWENDDTYSGRFRLNSQENTEEGITYFFTFKAKDGKGEEWDIKMRGREEDYEGGVSDVVGHARMSKAFKEAEI